MQSTDEGTPAAKRFPNGNHGFRAQHSFAFSVRSSDIFHDRAIIVDGKQVFVLGASIKDAGKRAFNIVPVEAPPMVEGMIRYAEEEWSRAQKVF